MPTRRTRTVFISTPHIALGALLKLAGFLSSGGEAKSLVAGGKVLVNGGVCLQRGRKIYPGDTVELSGEVLKVLSRGPEGEADGG